MVWKSGFLRVELTSKEMEALALFADLLSPDEIAERMGITRGTVDRHLANIRAKMGVTSTREAARRWAALHREHVGGISSLPISPDPAPASVEQGASGRDRTGEHDHRPGPRRDVAGGQPAALPDLGRRGDGRGGPGRSGPEGRRRRPDAIAVSAEPESLGDGPPARDHPERSGRDAPDPDERRAARAHLQTLRDDLAEAIGSATVSRRQPLAATIRELVAAAFWAAAGLTFVIVAAIVISYVVGAADLRMADLNLGALFREPPPSA
ncbi:helix-turn-helix transcriptional regulator (plasmid) [Brevundimonas staleyi]|uniref:Helix-turn-helix transcriptional regulator n=1 Tax=Brevundimonas staleyi TaxID=74326 RepID=A0ABW0FPT9_9CAUL